MNFVEAIQELWSRKFLVVAGVLVALGVAFASVSNISLLPPKLNKGTLEYYNGRTQIFVDSQDSSIADLGRDLGPMVARANLYSRFLTTPAALRFIGAAADVSPNEIYAEGPYQLGQARFIQEPTAERTGSQLIGRKAPYRLRFDSDPELPIVTVYTEAPSAKIATALADGAANGLAKYVEKLQDNQNIPERRRVMIRPLGSTTGAPVTAGADKKIAAFVFFVVLGIWCLGILGIRRLRDAWDQADEMPPPTPYDPHNVFAPPPGDGIHVDPRIPDPHGAGREGEELPPLYTRH